MHHLDEGQWVGRGPTARAHTLLKQCHRKLLVGYAVWSSTYILFGFVRDMEVNSHQEVFKAFCSVIHNPQLETLFILESLRQSTTESVRRKHLFTTALELVKDALERTEDAGIAHALVRCELPKAAAEDVQVPQNL